MTERAVRVPTTQLPEEEEEVTPLDAFTCFYEMYRCARDLGPGLYIGPD